MTVADRPALLDGLTQAAREVPVAELPRLRAALAEADSIAFSRLVAAAATTTNDGGVTQEDRLLTYRKAAEWLDVSVSYIETLVRQGTLPSVTLPATAKGTGAHRRERRGRLKRIRLSALRAM